MKFCTVICTKEQMEKAGYELRLINTIETEFLSLINAEDIEKGDLVYDVMAGKMYQIDADLNYDQWREDNLMMEYCKKTAIRNETLHINPEIDEEWQKDTIYGKDELDAKKRRQAREKRERRQAGLGWSVPAPTQTEEVTPTQTEEVTPTQTEEVYKSYLKDNCIATLDHITYGYTSSYDLSNPTDCIRFQRDVELCRLNRPQELNSEYDIQNPQWSDFGIEYDPDQLTSLEWQEFYWHALQQDALAIN